MINSVKKLFGFGPKTDFSALVNFGAIILDVRSKSEYKTGHIAGSINIPVEELDGQLSRFPKKEKAIITCCASGGRSALARNILLTNGYTQVYNGGGWKDLRGKI